MTTSATQVSAPLAADGVALARVLQMAGLTKASPVRVTGPAGLTAIYWLGRHGYNHAAYVNPNQVGAMTACPALLIPHACGARELAILLQDGECLREEGILIVQASPTRYAQGHDSVANLLRELGFELVHDFYDRGRDLYIARRRGGQAKAA